MCFAHAIVAEYNNARYFPFAIASSSIDERKDLIFTWKSNTKRRSKCGDCQQNTPFWSLKQILMTKQIKGKNSIFWIY